MTKIVAVSDLHGYMPELPQGDILIIAGDVSPILFDRDIDKSLDWLEDRFLPWVDQFDGPRVMIAGNHDFAIGAPGCWDSVSWRDYDQTFYLEDSFVSLDGLKIYGFPWVPNLPAWAFSLEDEDLRLAYQDIDPDCDIIISHGPPLGMCDQGSYHYGALSALEMIGRVKPKLFICGHIHEAYGKDHWDETDIYNVSHVDIDYWPAHDPVVIEI